MAEKIDKGKAGTEGVLIELPMAGFRKRMLFNRFAVARDGDHRLLQFGCVAPVGWLMDHFVCAVHVSLVELQRQENMDYLGRLGELTSAPPVWQLPENAKNGVELVTQLNMCRHGTFAEIAMHNLSMRTLVNLGKNQKQPPALLSEPVALLRSETELHKHFIRELYST